MKQASSLHVDNAGVGYVVSSNRRDKRVGDCRKAWATAFRRASVPPELFYDLRRTAVRNMVRAGVSQPVAVSIAGHKTASKLLRHKTTSGTAQREALARIRSDFTTQPASSNLVALPPTGTEKLHRTFTLTHKKRIRGLADIR